MIAKKMIFHRVVLGLTLIFLLGVNCSGSGTTTAPASTTITRDYCGLDNKLSLTVSVIDSSADASDPSGVIPVTYTNSSKITINPATHQASITVPVGTQSIIKVIFPPTTEIASADELIPMVDPRTSTVTGFSDGTAYVFSDLTEATNGETVAYYFCPYESSVSCYPLCYSGAVHFEIDTGT